MESRAFPPGWTGERSTSFTGTIYIDSTYGITAHNLGQEWWHTVQRDSILFAGQAASIYGGTIAGALAGQLGWAGARVYNSVDSLLNGTPGFGPLDKDAEVIGQQFLAGAALIEFCPKEYARAPRVRTEAQIGALGVESIMLG